MKKIKNKIASAKKKTQEYAPEIAAVGATVAILTITTIFAYKTTKSTPTTQEDDIDTCISDNGQVMVTITDAGLAEMQTGISSLFRFGNDVLALHKIKYPIE